MKDRIKIFLGVVIGFIVVVTISMYTINYFYEDKIHSVGDILNFGEDLEQSSIELDDIKISANIPVFMYHWIKEDTGGYEYPENMVKPDELRKQMEYLKENDYDVIWVTDIDSLQHYKKPVILTFDDGWADVYNIAFPIAKELNMKYCMYIITDLVGTPGYCTWEMLEEMKDSGLVQLDSHTLSHPYLDQISQSQVDDELIKSKEVLKEKLDIDSRVICYPSGQENDYVIKVAEENYDFGLLMLGGIWNYDSDTSNMYKITRIYAKRSMALNEFIDYCKRTNVSVN